MISVNEGVYCLSTRTTSLIMRRTAHGQLELVHYGTRVDADDAEALALKNTSPRGNAVNYTRDDPAYTLDEQALVWSGSGRGDYREPPIEVFTNAGGTTDFRVTGHEIMDGVVTEGGLPSALLGDQTLLISLADETVGAVLTLYFTVFENADVITRRSVLINSGEDNIALHRLMSSMLDLYGTYELTSFHGAWLTEAHRETASAGSARLVLDSLTGTSSNRCNPGFLLSEPGTDQEHGRVYGFNLIWSGNHYASVQRSRMGLTRVMQGVCPTDFLRTLRPGERFFAPEAVMSFSDGGFNGLSAHMHDFVNRHVIPEHWQERRRPVVFNSWEGCGFDFTERRLNELGRRAARLGCELFVLDDGWFGDRDDDTAGLGDYNVNISKLPGGLSGLRMKLEKAGLELGLWVEPEAVNPDSDLYRAHPDWALTAPGREPVFGRNELLLDLTRADVRNYIVESVGGILDRLGITYIKWDMNRHAAALGAQSYDYVLGLYDVLRRVFSTRPGVLLESCASGGNRFDLGMLCFGPQIWVSDNTDPVERLDIQDGVSYLYPLSCMSAHVSASPHLQTLRRTPLYTRANVAFFGVLGYELDLKTLTPLDEQDIREQIEFYKNHRRLFQFGRFRRLPAPEGETRWQVSGGDNTAVVGVFRRLHHAASGADELRFAALEPRTAYRVATRPQNLRLGDYRELLRHVADAKISPGSLLVTLADRVQAVPDCAEAMVATGAALMSGVRLNDRYTGAQYGENIRMQGDFGSVLYVVGPDAAARLPEKTETAMADEARREADGDAETTDGAAAGADAAARPERGGFSLFRGRGRRNT